uniref:Uncharacterized protein n=1 Tax=Lepeophtheirus salmonis TaxID=72036 RepID=A0A0K2UHP4_LEPSM
MSFINILSAKIFSQEGLDLSVRMTWSTVLRENNRTFLWPNVALSYTYVRCKHLH